MLTARLVVLGSLLLLISAMAVVAQPSHVVGDQDRFAVILETGSPEERVEVIAAIRDIPSSARRLLLIDAVIGEVHRIGADLDERARMSRGGESFGPLPYPAEHLRDALELLTESEDPRVVPALIRFVDTGGMVGSALAAFGAVALPYLDTVAVGEEGDDSTSLFRSSAALGVLQIMLDGEYGPEPFAVRHPLSAADRQRIERIVAERLTGQQHAWVVRGAIGLAVATGNARLIRQVSEIADDAVAVRRFGITDPAEIERVQRRAAEALERLDR